MEQIAKEEQRKAWKMQGMTTLNAQCDTGEVLSWAVVSPCVHPVMAPKYCCLIHLLMRKDQDPVNVFTKCCKILFKTCYKLCQWSCTPHIHILCMVCVLSLHRNSARTAIMILIIYSLIGFLRPDVIKPHQCSEKMFKANYKGILPASLSSIKHMIWLCIGNMELNFTKVSLAYHVHCWRLQHRGGVNMEPKQALSAPNRTTDWLTAIPAGTVTNYLYSF